jgi:mono/diheme cytochrome c family protein
MSVRIATLWLTVLSLSFAASSQGADAAAGKALVDAQCADCHEPADWKDEQPEALAALTKDIVSGKTKHKTKLKLSDAEIADIAAYWGTGSK